MATPDAPVEWPELSIVKLLDPTYREWFHRVRNCVTPLLGTRPLGAEEFIDHDVQHSARVLQRIGEILPDHTKLNQPELYILALAALLHDAGLWTSKQEALQQYQSQEFRDSCDPIELAKLDELFAEERLRWMGELSLQRIVAWRHRSTHPERLFSAVLQPETELGRTLRVLIGEKFVEAVTVVSVAHSWSRERILQDDDLRDQQFGSDVANLRFLASLLRLGDLLDLGDGRVSTLLWDYLAPLNSVSEAHWRKEATLRMELCGPELIRVSGKFDVDRHGIVAAEAYRLALDWLDMLQNEIEGVALVLNSRIEPRHRQRLQFGQMILDTKRVHVNGLAFDGKVTFQLPQKRVIELLGDEIYADKSIFIRELLQNAVDATRAQMVRDARNELDATDRPAQFDEPWNWSKEITSNPKYRIEVNATSSDSPSQPYIDISIADHGIGMSLTDIRDYFLQVGTSFYQSNRYRQEFTHTPISQFGIGFLSCWAIADRIEVVSRLHQEHAGLRLLLQKPSDHFIVERMSNAEPGTKVTLRISRREMEALGLETFPIRSTHFFDEPDKFRDAISAVTLQWAAYVEFPLLVQGIHVEPKDPLTFTPAYISEVKSIESMPLHVMSEDKREIAQGRVFYRVFPGTHLPALHSVSPQTCTVASFRGIGLSGGRISFPDHQMMVAIDYRRLPPRSMTAGRSLRVGWEFLSRVGDFACHQLYATTTAGLGTVSDELPVIWSHYLDRRIGSPRRDDPLLPVRTEAGMVWQTWEEACRQHPTVMLVPYGIAWRGAWNSAVPAVGMPDEMLNSIANRAARKSEPELALQDCEIVSADGICSAYLWPPHADTRHTNVLSAKHTFLHSGLLTWATDSYPRRLRDAIPIDARLVSKDELTDYDRDGNPWERWGVHQYSRLDDGSDIGKDARALFESHADWSLKDRELVVTLPGVADWV